MRRLFQKTLNKVLNDDGQDITPKKISNWNSNTPAEDLEAMVPIVSTVKKKVLGNKGSFSSASTTKSEYFEDNPFAHSLFVMAEAESENMRVTLTESDTIWLFDLPDVSLTTASESIENVIKRNQAYAQLANRASEKLVDRSSMTLHGSVKNKNIQTSVLTFKDVQTQVSPFYFYDEEYNKDESNAPGVNVVWKKSKSSTKRTTQATISSSTSTSRSDNTLMNRKITGSDEAEKLSVTKYFHYLCSIAERLLQYNQFYMPMALYKKVPLVNDESLGGDASQDEHYGTVTTGGMPSYSGVSHKHTEALNKAITFDKLYNISSGMVCLRPLWKYRCVLNKEYNVSCMSFNHQNPDLMAAAYSQLDYGLQKDGYVCCWCIKNFEYPERLIKVESGATAVSFSCFKPYLLAVGLFDGTLLFYNVSTKPPTLVHSSSAIAESHRKPIFALEWMEKNGYEMVLSTSTDGKVLQWVFNNELQCTKILELKLVGKHEKTSKNLNTTNSGMLCLDCCPERSEIYLVGTDNGLIHRCSAIHANQFFKTYTGHIAPVYKVKWCPYEASIFASCGADMSVKIWDRDRTEPLLDLLPINPPNSPALDLSWCKDRKGTLVCVFGSELQIWDLFASKLDPCFLYTIDDIYTSSLTALLYSHDSEAIYLGDCLGDISVFRVKWEHEVPMNANLYDFLMA